MASHQPASQRRRAPTGARAPASVSDTTSRRIPPPRKRPNTHWRSREYLTAAEVETLIGMAKRLGRHRHRDATMIQLAYRHGLRASEIGLLQRTDVDLKQGRITIHRLKGSLSGIYPLQPDVIKLLRAYLRARTDASPYLFISNRGVPIDRRTLWCAMQTYGKKAGCRRRSGSSIASSTRSPRICSTHGESCASCRIGWATRTCRTPPGTPS